MIKESLHIFQKAFINSYAQLFFADSKVFAWLLLISSFISPTTGLSGLIATVAAIVFAWWMGLNRILLSYGTFSYNALMVGLVLGGHYHFSWGFLLVLLVGAVFSVLIVVWLNTVFAKYAVPSLSLSFLLTLWLITLAIRGFSNVNLNERDLFRFNEWYLLGGSRLVEWMTALDQLEIPQFLEVYLKSLSAVFFQYNIISGAIILIGLLIWSRIGFLLSALGFVIGYFFYYGLSGEFTQLYYSYIGFNFILTAIALGGFYLIPSRASFILVVIVMPIIGVFITGLNQLLGVWQLPLYSFPFALTVILTILLLHQRTYFKRLKLVPFQYYSPEKNLYQYTNSFVRFGKAKGIALRLPFFGEWQVSQGYDGAITHKKEWRYALDFVVVDETAHTFKIPGEIVTDFYCYNLPVMSPADGYVCEVADGIDDNGIGEIDIKKNWGNTLVIKHADGLYTKLSHLKRDSLTVKVNDYVKQGQIIATVGNSGRSPEPHLHFQLQATPYIGSETMQYPLAYFITRKEQAYQLHEFEVPQEGAHVHHPIQTPLLVNALNFVPGKKWYLQVSDANAQKSTLVWECMVDAYNQTYLYCAKSKACAYFVNNGTVFYFTTFYGSKKSLLYEFYIGAHKILLGYYQHMAVKDDIPLSSFHHPVLLWLQDMVAPFYQFMQVEYQSIFEELDNEYAPNHVVIRSTISALVAGKTLKQKQHLFTFANGCLSQWSILTQGNTLYTVSCNDQL
ncbi:MAG: peptidase M23 [Bacteroidetes bacterium]|nr:MAG: peptidase M23 [Bacteroidota bacterium]